MVRGMSEATDALLAAYRDDLQRQLRQTAIVEGLFAREGRDGVTLLASVRIGSRLHRLSASGSNVVTAYAELVRTAPEPVLGAAYRELLDSVTSAG